MCPHIFPFSDTMSGEKTQFVPHSHLPYGEDGAGFYTDNTLGCFDVISKAQPLVLKAIGKGHVINCVVESKPATPQYG